MEYQNNQEAAERRASNRKKVEEFFSHGAHAPVELFDPDAVMVQPFFFPDNPGGKIMPDPAEQPPRSGDGEPPEWTVDWVWEPTTIWGTDDPDYFFAENFGSGRQMRGDGNYYPYSNHYFHTFRFREGKILEYREIGNPMLLMSALGVRYDPLPRPEDTMRELEEHHK